MVLINSTPIDLSSQEDSLVGVIPIIGGLGNLHIIVCIMQQVKEIFILNDI